MFLLCRENKILGRAKKGKAEEQSRPVRKMTEKYDRCPGRDAEQDVARRCFLAAAGQIRLDYHYSVDRITHSSRLYTRDGLKNIVQVGSL